VAKGGIKGPPITPPTPQPTQRTPAAPSDLAMWFPLNDGQHSSDGGGSLSLVVKQGLSNTYGQFTSSSQYGQLTFPDAGGGSPWVWDPTMGGYVYNNIAAQHAQSQHDPEITFLNFGGPFKTVSVWAKLMDGTITTSKATVLYKIFSSNTDCFIQIDQTTKFWEMGYHVSGSLKSLASSVAVITGRWYHLCMTWDGSTQRAYVDGELIGSQATGTPDVNGEIWSVGDRQSNDNGFRGWIWNLMFFNRALGGNEVKNLYLAPFDSFEVLTPPSPPLAPPPTPTPPTDPGPYLKVRHGGTSHGASVITVVTDYVVGDGDDMVLCDTTGGDINVTLPAVTAWRLGRRFVIKKKDNTGNAVNVSVDGGGGIDGTAFGPSPFSEAFESVEYQCGEVADNKYWIRASHKFP